MPSTRGACSLTKRSGDCESLDQEEKGNLRQARWPGEDSAAFVGKPGEPYDPMFSTSTG